MKSNNLRNLASSASKQKLNIYWKNYLKHLDLCLIYKLYVRNNWKILYNHWKSFWWNINSCSSYFIFWVSSVSLLISNYMAQIITKLHKDMKKKFQLCRLYSYIYIYIYSCIHIYIYLKELCILKFWKNRFFSYSLIGFKSSNLYENTW